MMRITVPGVGDWESYRVISLTVSGHGHSLIDLCAREATLTRYLPYPDRTFVDVQSGFIPNGLGAVVQADVLGDHPCLSASYDTAVCFDGIEHLHKSEGLRLIRRMTSIARRRVIFTPLGDYLVTPESTDPDAHRSGWNPADFPGWATVVWPLFHATLLSGVGAFWAWDCPDLRGDFDRVCRELTAAAIPFKAGV